MESEEGEDRKHDDDKADEIDDIVHGGNLLHCLSSRMCNPFWTSTVPVEPSFNRSGARAHSHCLMDENLDAALARWRVLAEAVTAVRERDLGRSHQSRPVMPIAGNPG